MGDNPSELTLYHWFVFQPSPVAFKLVFKHDPWGKCDWLRLFTGEQWSFLFPPATDLGEVVFWKWGKMMVSKPTRPQPSWSYRDTDSIKMTQINVGLPLGNSKMVSREHG